MLTALSCLLLMAESLECRKIRTLERIPVEKDFFLEQVVFIDIDDQGRTYVTNYPSAQVFYWNKDGSFDGVFGRKGEGPGEYGFGAALGPPRGYISVVDDRIYIYDGGSRSVSILTRDHGFIRRVTFEGLGGMINGFQVLGKERFLFYDSYFCAEKACRRILEYDGTGQLVKSWREVDDDTWSLVDAAGTKVNLFLFQPTLVMGLHRGRGEVVLAHAANPVLDIHDLTGNKLRSLTLPIPKKPVTKDDIAEFYDQEWMKNNDHIKAHFPEEKSYFDQILCLDEGYLVYHLSPLHGTADGFLVGLDGKMKGRFTLECGEGGGLFAPRGRLMAALVDEEGEFHLTEMRIE